MTFNVTGLFTVFYFFFILLERLNDLLVWKLNKHKRNWGHKFTRQVSWNNPSKVLILNNTTAYVQFSHSIQPSESIICGYVVTSTGSEPDTAGWGMSCHRNSSRSFNHQRLYHVWIPAVRGAWEQPATRQSRETERRETENEWRGGGGQINMGLVLHPPALTAVSC